MADQAERSVQSMPGETAAMAEGTGALSGFVFCAGTIVAYVASRQYFRSLQPHLPGLFSTLHSILLLCATAIWANRQSARYDWCVRPGRKLVAATTAVTAFLVVRSTIATVLPHPSFGLSFPLELIVIAPFAEELFFRGVLLDELSRAFGRVAGIILVSVLFGFLHSPQGLFVQMIVFSVILCLVRLRTRSIYTAIAVHMLWNVAAEAYRIRLLDLP